MVRTLPKSDFFYLSLTWTLTQPQPLLLETWNCRCRLLWIFMAFTQKIRSLRSFLWCTSELEWFVYRGKYTVVAPNCSVLILEGCNSAGRLFTCTLYSLMYLSSSNGSLTPLFPWQADAMSSRSFAPKIMKPGLIALDLDLKRIGIGLMSFG